MLGLSAHLNYYLFNGNIYLCPNTMLAHWLYLIGTLAVLAIAYILFMRKYYHLHEEYLTSLKK